MKLYQVGDTVIIKSEKWYYLNCDQVGYVRYKEVTSNFNDKMSAFCGMKAIITSIDNDAWSKNKYCYKIDIDKGMWHWNNFMFEDIKKIRRKKLKKINEKKNMLL